MGSLRWNITKFKDPNPRVAREAINPGIGMILG